MKIPVINDLLSSISAAVSNLSADSKEKEKIKSEITYAILSHYDKIAQMQRDIISNETKGNWLQRSWRPIVMLTFAAIVVLGVFIDIPILEEGSQFWDLLELGLGGYVIGRSAEKITTTIGKRLLK